MLGKKNMNNSEGQNIEVEYKPEDSPEKQLSDFKDFMREFKRQEEEAVKLINENKHEFDGATWHFGKINPDELTSEDMDMWEVVKTSLATSKLKGDKENRIPADTLMGIFEDYKKRVRESKNLSRGQFCAFIANKIGGPIGHEYVKRGNF